MPCSKAERSIACRLDRRRFLLASSLGVALLGGRTAEIARAAGVSRQGWLDRRGYGPFQVAATFPLDELHSVLSGLGEHEFELQRTLGIPPARTQVDVYLLSSAKEHHDYLAKIYPRVPYRRALYVQQGGRSSVFAYRHKDLPIDLRHECTHALLHSNLAMVPLWLDEGLAEYFEMPANQRAFGHPHLARLRWDFRLGMIRTLESLEQARDLQDMGATEYRFSWAWVHFMLHGPAEIHRVLVDFLSDIRRGNPPGVLSERLRAAAPRIESLMVQHFKHWRK